jgi:hypothetical protein
LVVVLSCAAPLVACSAITDFTGFVGDASSSDGAAHDSADASTNDGSTATDGATPMDASTPDSFTPPPRFCADASGFVLCDDFDDIDANLKNIWGTVSVGNMGAIAVDNGASVSAPASLLSTCAGGGMFNGSLVRRDFTGHTRAVIAADLRLDAFDKVGYGSLMEIHLEPFPDGFSDYRVALIYVAGTMTLDVYAVNQEGGTTQQGSQISLDFSQWQRISIELAMNPTPHASAYDASGKQLATLPMPAFANYGTNTGQYAEIGLTYLTNNNTPWKVRHDNVTVTLGD